MIELKSEIPLGRHHSRADTSSCRQHLVGPREALEPSSTPGSGPSLVEDLPLPARRIYYGPNDSDNSYDGAPRVYCHKASDFLLWEASEEGKFTTMWCWKDRFHPPIQVNALSKDQQTRVRNFSCTEECFDRQGRKDSEDPRAFDGAYAFCPGINHRPTRDDSDRLSSLLSVANGVWRSRCSPCRKLLAMSRSVGSGNQVQAEFL